MSRDAIDWDYRSWVIDLETALSEEAAARSVPGGGVAPSLEAVGCVGFAGRPGEAVR